MQTNDVVRLPRGDLFGIKRLVGSVLIATILAIAVGQAAPAAGQGPLAELGAAPAEAYEGGWDRDHWWLKVTRGEVLGKAVAGICWYFVKIPASSYVCTPISLAATRIIGGSSGVWAEIYPPRGWRLPYFRIGTW